MRNYFLIIIVLTSYFGYGQPANQPVNFAPDLNIKTPEVGALLKTLETPVSYNTGQVSTSIPIFEIREGDISYPITVDYNSSGVQVNERASWVGLGFNIKQPQVTRMVKGIPDDQGGFITEALYLVDNLYVQLVWHGAHHDATNGIIDLESDEYNAVLPNGESIKFYFSQHRTAEAPYGEIIQVPYARNKIIPLFSNIGHINGWEITSTSGFTYKFENGNITAATFSYSTSEENLVALSGKSKGTSYLTSWMLKEIKSPNNNQINFYYTSNYYEDCSFTSQKRDVSTDINPNIVIPEKVYTNYQETKGFNFLLASIEGNFGKVEFIKNTTSREDYSFGQQLKEILIYNQNETLINRYGFEYLYKESVPPANTIHSCGGPHSNADLIKRMFLDKVIIYGNDNSQSPLFYSFKYNNQSLPHRFSYATDLWGYYNGKESNQTIVPTIRRFDSLMPNRFVNPATSQAGLLTEIVFPTGGSTLLEYENNRGINTNPMVKFYDIPNGLIPPIDGISIIPSVKQNLEFSAQSSIPISIENTENDGQEIIYEMPFTIDENVIGYYYRLLNGQGDLYSTNINVNIRGLCQTCDYPEDSLPQEGDCSVSFKIVKEDGTLVYDYKLISGVFEGNFEFAVDTPEIVGHIISKNYKLIVKIITGNDTLGLNNQLYNPNTNNVTVSLSWDIIDDAIVTKIGDTYDMPVGGHRIKSIKSYTAPNVLALEKQFDYKNEQGIESGYFNLHLVNVFMYSHVIYINSDNYFPLQSYAGQPVGYQHVTEKLISANEVQETSYEYNYLSLDPNAECYKHLNSTGSGIYPCFEDPLNGKLAEVTVGSKRKVYNIYQMPSLDLFTRYIRGYNVFNRLELMSPIFLYPEFMWAFYEISNFHDQELVNILTKEYENGQEITTQQINQYDNSLHFNLESERKSNSKGDFLETKYFYPEDPEMNQKPFVQNLISQNRIAAPLVTQTFHNSEKLSEQETEYGNDTSPNNLILPKFIYTKKGEDSQTNASEKRITFNSYDAKGNITQYTLEGGIPVSIIWGYNKTQPIAKIENATNAQVASALGMSVAQATEANISAINNLRSSLPTSMITTYTYIPLVGVETITDPKGDTMRYEYDTFGRLQAVFDKNGNKLSENEYHYATQN